MDRTDQVHDATRRACRLPYEIAPGCVEAAQSERDTCGDRKREGATTGVEGWHVEIISGAVLFALRAGACK
jgi:hypothetical protein